MTGISRRAGRRPGRPGETGFTLIELAIVMVVAGLLLVPLLRMSGSAVVSNRLKKTQSVLETASEALISFAAVNGGCLPFAADFEGGLPDTDASGAASAAPDKGKGIEDQHAGDLPWRDLGLTNGFLDGDGLRIQYFVATPYTDNALGASGITCEAGFRGFPWDNSVTYNATPTGPLWVYEYKPMGSTDPKRRTLFKITNQPLPAGIHPTQGGINVIAYESDLPDKLLEVRRGPDVTAPSPQKDAISKRNIFILIAPGRNRNAVIDRLFVRDSNHTAPGGVAWPLGVTSVDKHLFSSEHNVDAADSANDGDDTLFVMSFIRFKAEMGKHGLNMERVCENSC